MSLITDKQRQYIEEMQEFSEYPLPIFNGTTMEEANEYIKKYSKLAHECTWSIENGY